MASKNLRMRDNWQNKSGKLAKNAEYKLTDVLKTILPEEKYHVNDQIKDFNSVYSNVDLPKNIQSKIYQPDKDIREYKWGWVPDNSIENKITGKKIFIELKRQDGWVENTKESAGRGNAHERGMKHFTPGILNKERKLSKINDGFLPFIIIFIGDITRDPKRNRELYFWFEGHEDNYFMWRHDKEGKVNPKELYSYLKSKILPHLE